MIPLIQNLLTSHQLSERLNITPATIRKWARQGKLLAVKIGDDWRFSENLTMPIDSNSMDGMGRHKEGYKGPKYLIRKPGSPFWYIKWKGICKSTETDNLIQAQIRLAEEQQRYWAKQILQKDEPHSVLFSTLLTRYLKEVSPTKASARSDFTNARRPLEFFGDKPIDMISIQEGYRYQDWRKIQYVQPKKKDKEPTKLITGATINRELALVKHSLKYAVRWGYIAQSPLPEGQMEGMNETKRKRYITDEEFSAIKEKLPEMQKWILSTLYYTAQRMGKVLDLQWRNVDLQNRTITFGTGQGNKRVAEICWINDHLFQILQGIWEARKKKTIISRYIFCSQNGSPIKSIKKAWKTACKKAGVEDARVHDIRHKAITDMRRAGIPIDQAMRAAGHLTAQMSERYTHWGIEQVKEAFEALS